MLFPYCHCLTPMLLSSVFLFFLEIDSKINLRLQTSLLSPQISVPKRDYPDQPHFTSPAGKVRNYHNSQPHSI